MDYDPGDWTTDLTNPVVQLALFQVEVMQNM
jgi:hypothetical protein